MSKENKEPAKHNAKTEPVVNKQEPADQPTPADLKEADAAPVESEVLDGRPPGFSNRPGTHGPQSPVVTVAGEDHLRAVMSKTANEPIDVVCEEAALEIERLREAVASRTPSNRRPFSHQT